MTYQVVWETGKPVWAPKQHFSSFLLKLYFNKKYVEVAINDFTMHLIISKWLRNKNADRKEKQRDKKTGRRRSERRNCLRECFHSFKYVIDQANVRFF